VFFEPDFLFECASELARCLLEFGDATAERPAELRKFTRPKNYQRDYENNEKLRHSEGTKHRALLCKNRLTDRRDRPVHSDDLRTPSASSGLVAVITNEKNSITRKN
jgi:hypothetical protein